jgi:hypothetical protein
MSKYSRRSGSVHRSHSVKTVRQTFDCGMPFAAAASGFALAA